MVANATNDFLRVSRNLRYRVQSAAAEYLNIIFVALIRLEEHFEGAQSGFSTRIH